MIIFSITGYLNAISSLMIMGLDFPCCHVLANDVTARNDIAAFLKKIYINIFKKKKKKKGTKPVMSIVQAKFFCFLLVFG